MRRPRREHPIQASDPDPLADEMLVQLRQAHDHEPPREHVLARLAQNQDAGYQ